MHISEFKKRIEPFYQKLGITNFQELPPLMGYSKVNACRGFYANGVSKRALAFLNVLEIFFKEEVHRPNQLKHRE